MQINSLHNNTHIYQKTLNMFRCNNFTKSASVVIRLFRQNDWIYSNLIIFIQLVICNLNISFHLKISHLHIHLSFKDLKIFMRWFQCIHIHALYVIQDCSHYHVLETMRKMQYQNIGTLFGICLCCGDDYAKIQNQKCPKVAIFLDKMK